jgi:hypothetical protein
MPLAAQVLEKLFENHYNFAVPASGPHKLPYTCSFHWFRAPNGQLIGVDVVRSDDMGRRVLRVFAIQSGSDTVSSLLLEGPTSDWEPFATHAPPAMPQGKPVMGRGEKLASRFRQRPIDQFRLFPSQFQGTGSRQRDRRKRPLTGPRDGDGLSTHGDFRLDHPQRPAHGVGPSYGVRVRPFRGYPALVES